jgi:hypothetical protein
MTRTAPTPSRWTRLLRSSRLVALLGLGAGLGLAGLLASCGGDVGTGGTGAPASTYSAGRISGFGSVIVNGVRYDDSAATIVDDDGGVHTAADLLLGMTVAIDAQDIRTDATGAKVSVAKTVTFGEEIAGPVATVNAAGSTFVVLGQTVTVDGATVFGGYTTGLAGVSPGDLVEVFAFLDTTSGTYKATRIDKQASLTDYTLQGVVAALDSLNHRFSIGTAVIDDGGVSSMPTLSDGTLVRVHLRTTAAGGVWTATSVKVVTPHELAQDEHTEVEGIVSDFVSLSDFKVDGVPVNAGGSGVVFTGGTAASVQAGIRVEVEGVNHAGVLVATSVDVRQDDAGDREVELHGAVSAVDAVARTFTLREQTVHWSDATVFSGGTSAKLVNGANVEMHGTLSSSGSAVEADTIAFDN